MTDRYGRFTFMLILLSTVLYILSALLFSAGYSRVITEYYGGLIGFYALFTLSFQVLLKWLATKGAKRFIAYYLGLSGLKMFFLLGIMAAFSILHPEKAPPFILTYFVFYVVYTIFETWHALKIKS
jgi:F0F1-type ATP synthase assembly protein I